VSASAHARAVAKSGTLGCPSSAKLVSSKSCAWPAAPLQRAAQVGDVRSALPITVQSGAPPSRRATVRVMRATGSAAPARTTPRVSIAARRTWTRAASGQLANPVVVTNSARRVVAVMSGAAGGGPAETQQIVPDVAAPALLAPLFADARDGRPAPALEAALPPGRDGA